MIYSLFSHGLSSFKAVFHITEMFSSTPLILDLTQKNINDGRLSAAAHTTRWAENPDVQGC